MEIISGIRPSTWSWLWFNPIGSTGSPLWESIHSSCKAQVISFTALKCVCIEWSWVKVGSLLSVRELQPINTAIVWELASIFEWIKAIETWPLVTTRSVPVWECQERRNYTHIRFPLLLNILGKLNLASLGSRENVFNFNVFCTAEISGDIRRYQAWKIATVKAATFYPSRLGLNINDMGWCFVKFLTALTSQCIFSQFILLLPVKSLELCVKIKVELQHETIRKRLEIISWRIIKNTWNCFNFSIIKVGTENNDISFCVFVTVFILR